jgi:hypothetical protein
VRDETVTPGSSITLKGSLQTPRLAISGPRKMPRSGSDGQISHKEVLRKAEQDDPKTAALTIKGSGSTQRAKMGVQGLRINADRTSPMLIPRFTYLYRRSSRSQTVSIPLPRSAAAVSTGDA